VGKIEGRRSKSALKQREYQRSWLAKRRKAFAKTRDAVRAAAPPPIFGSLTDILVVLAKSGPVRRVALCEMFSEMRTGSLAKSDFAGMIVVWKLPNRNRRGQRGVAFALNPQFAFAKEVRALLLALGESFPFTATCDMTSRERQIPKRKRIYNLDRIFFFETRLRILQTLDILGGKAKIEHLADSTANMRLVAAKRLIAHLVKERILRKDGVYVQFPRAGWCSALRKLLRAHRKIENPDLEKGVRQRDRLVRSLRAKGARSTLFGRNATERVLTTLAVHGPLKPAEFERTALPGSPPYTVRRLMKSGVLARVKIVKGPPHHDYYMIGLNSAHPIYKELRSLLCAVAGAPPSRKPQLRDRRKEYGLDGLFGTAQRLNGFVSLATCIHQEVDPSTISRLFPEHDIGVITRNLRTWAAKDLLIRRVEGLLTFYRFNPKHPYAKTLQVLLERIGQIWPEYNVLPKLEIDLYPERRAKIEQRLARPLRKARTANKSAR
jgi:hypothetical protein